MCGCVMMDKSLVVQKCYFTSSLLDDNVRVYLNECWSWRNGDEYRLCVCWCLWYSVFCLRCVLHVGDGAGYWHFRRPGQYDLDPDLADSLVYLVID